MEIFFRITSFATHSAAKLSLFPVFENGIFFQKKKFFFQKKLSYVFEKSEKSYYFSRILWQICYNFAISEWDIRGRIFSIGNWMKKSPPSVDDFPSLL